MISPSNFIQSLFLGNFDRVLDTAIEPQGEAPAA